MSKLANSKLSQKEKGEKRKRGMSNLVANLAFVTLYL
jgi:hypothetical protein